MASMIERYGVYWVDLDPVRGSEIAKTRPAVVISDDKMNAALKTLVVCPVTSRLHPRWPSRIRVSIDGKSAEIAVDQVRTIDKARIGEMLDKLDDGVVAEIRHTVTAMYGVLSAH
jgi:mRNA interferase MazF